MMKRTLLLLSVLFFAFRASDTIRIKLPAHWPKPEHRLSFDSNAVLLGRMLFYDPVLSANNMVSCASCHSPYNSFAHTDHRLSHGIDDRMGIRNAPPLINLAWRRDFMWDGFTGTMEQQIMFPVDHPDEMGSSFDSLALKLTLAGGYGKYFQRAFGDEKITNQRAMSAISQFLFSLVSANSKYDQMKKGEALFTSQEQNGYKFFKQACSSCHREPLFTNNGFESNRLPMDTVLRDLGRMRITGNRSDSLFFRVPTLRNIEYTYPYMHDGRFNSLWQVMDHYAHSEMLGHGMRFTSETQVDLMAFLLTLSDREFVLGNHHGYPNQAFQEISNIRKQ